MNLSTGKMTIYRLFILLATLFVISTGATLIEAASASALRGLAGLLSLSMGGLVIAADERIDGRLQPALLMRLLPVGWLLLVLITVVGPVMTVRWQAGLQVLLVAAAVIIAACSSPGMMSSRRLRLLRLWSLFMAADMLLALFLLAVPDALLVVRLRLLAVWSGGAVCIGFWLMHRFSNITPAWRDQGVVVVAPALAFAGMLVVTVDLHPLIGWAASAASLMGWMLTAAHSYRALSDRNSSRTLAAHWYTLGLLLWLAALVILGVPASVPPLHLWIEGTTLITLQEALAGWATAAVGLGVLNQGMAEMRTENRRVTGLMPFWLVAFGLLVSALALAGAGLVQIYAERVFAVDADTLYVSLRPLRMFDKLGTAAVFTGAVIYGLGFYARRLRLAQP